MNIILSIKKFDRFFIIALCAVTCYMSSSLRFLYFTKHLYSIVMSSCSWIIIWDSPAPQPCVVLFNILSSDLVIENFPLKTLKDVNVWSWVLNKECSVSEVLCKVSLYCFIDIFLFILSSSSNQNGLAFIEKGSCYDEVNEILNS